MPIIHCPFPWRIFSLEPSSPSTSTPSYLPCFFLPKFHSFLLSLSWCIIFKLFQLQLVGGVFSIYQDKHCSSSSASSLSFFFFGWRFRNWVSGNIMLDLHFPFLLHGHLIFGSMLSCSLKSLLLSKSYLLDE